VVIGPVDEGETEDEGFGTNTVFKFFSFQCDFGSPLFLDLVPFFPISPLIGSLFFPTNPSNPPSLLVG